MKKDRLTFLLVPILFLTLLCKQVLSDRGTFFFLDLTPGMAFFPDPSYVNDPQFAFGAVLGVGGKYRYFPVRGYLIFNYGLTLFSTGNVKVSNTEFSGHLNNITAGIRLLIPLIGNLRFYGDGSWGNTMLSAKITSRGKVTYDDSDLFTSILGVGLQYRVIRNLSFGLRGEFHFYSFTTGDPRSVESSVLNENGTDNIRLLTTLTLHF